MIFWHAMPGLFGGMGNYFIPIFNTSIEVGYPRINSVSLLLGYVYFNLNNLCI
jgi:cytochrome c oxidase subunit 1